ncbi:MAG TPA: hypothetical protein VHK46_09075 [Gaiellaceae bacterium]|nr:hypothetical protein [Gaiellaceae bacterium]
MPAVPEPDEHARSKWRSPRAYSVRLPSTTPEATAIGTMPVGRTNSIGTRISCVGTAEPVPISKSSRNASA